MEHILQWACLPIPKRRHLVHVLCRLLEQGLTSDSEHAECKERDGNAAVDGDYELTSAPRRAEFAPQ